MKTTVALTALFIATAGFVSAADTAKPEACCAEPATPPPAACCAETPATKASSCDCAGCAEKPAAQPDACCAAEPAPEKIAPADACCAAPADESPATATTYSANSLYQADAQFTDDAGQPFVLGSLQGRPVVLTMFFASCGYACPLIVSDMLAIQEKLPAGLRERTAFVLVSFDPARDTPAALARYRTQRALNAQWTLLHGDDASVREIAALLGVKYKQTADGSFSHSNLVTILNPAGEIVHQRTGLKGGLAEAAAALIAATPAK